MNRILVETQEENRESQSNRSHEQTITQHRAKGCEAMHEGTTEALVTTAKTKQQHEQQLQSYRFIGKRVVTEMQGQNPTATPAEGTTNQSKNLWSKHQSRRTGPAASQTQTAMAVKVTAKPKEAITDQKPHEQSQLTSIST